MELSAIFLCFFMKQRERVSFRSWNLRLHADAFICRDVLHTICVDQKSSSWKWHIILVEAVLLHSVILYVTVTQLCLFLTWMYSGYCLQILAKFPCCHTRCIFLFILFTFSSGKSLAHIELPFMSSHWNLTLHAIASQYCWEMVLLLKAKCEGERGVYRKREKKGTWRQI